LAAVLEVGDHSSAWFREISVVMKLTESSGGRTPPMHPKSNNFSKFRALLVSGKSSSQHWTRGGTRDIRMRDFEKTGTLNIKLVCTRAESPQSSTNILHPIYTVLDHTRTASTHAHHYCHSGVANPYVGFCI
jgi:hypothetical protein